MRASTRESIFASQLLRIVFIFEGKKLGQAAAKTFGLEVSFDHAAVAKGNHAGLLGHDDDDGVAFLREPERGTVPKAERAVEVGALGDGENARGGDDAVVADDDAAVVQRGLWEEKADHEFGRKRAVNLHAALGEALDILPALDGDERAELAVGEVEGHLAHEVERGAALLRAEEQAVAAERREAAPQLGLEDDDQRDDEHFRQALEDRADDGEAEELREHRGREKNDDEADEDVRAGRAAEEFPGVVNRHREQHDLGGVLPMERRELRELRDDHAAASGLRMASVMRSASAFGRASWTRKTLAPCARP